MRQGAEGVDAPTVREALAAFYAGQGMPPDGGGSASRWAIEIPGWFSVALSNFRWRRKALPVHDLHHVLTGYPCSPAGEFEMAAWEFAAGRYPHPLATAFCLPLVGMGAVLRPRRTFAAFVRGRASTTLYSEGLTPAVMNASLTQIRRSMLPHQLRRARLGDALAYVALAAAAVAWMLAPFAALALVAAVLA